MKSIIKEKIANFFSKKEEFLLEERIGDGCLIRRHPTSANLLIIFSAVDIERGKFLGEGSLFTTDKFDSNIVFLNDFNRQWYLNGIEGFGEGIDETISLIEKLKKSLLKKEGVYICFGNSMGAFGAALYGSILNVDLVIAPGIEIYTGNKLGIARYYLKRETNKVDLRNYIKKSRTRFHFILGEDFLGDVVGLLKVQDLPNVCVQTVVNCSHSTFRYLWQTYKINNLINDYINYIKSIPVRGEGEFRYLPIVKKIDEGVLVKHYKIAHLLYLSELVIKDKKSFFYEKMINRLLKIMPGDFSDKIIKSYIMSMIARIYIIKDNEGKFISPLYALQAYHLNQRNVRNAAFLSNYYIRMKDYELSLAFSNKAIKNRSFYSAVSFKEMTFLSENIKCLLALSRHEEARAKLGEWLKAAAVPERAVLEKLLLECQSASKPNLD